MLLPEIVGVNVTVTASPTLPEAVTTPVVALTVKDDTYFVAEKDVAQLSNADAPVDWTISVTQVRALLAAKTISDALARFV